MIFKLDERLAQDSVYVAHLAWCQLRLHKDSRYPWLIVIPERPLVTELYELEYSEQVEYMRISSLVCKVLNASFSPHKINVASLGNIVKQLHIHHIARFEYDETWPGPVWGLGKAILYSNEHLQKMVASLRQTITEINQGEIDVNYHHK